MIYFRTADARRIIILDPLILQRLREGHGAEVRDKSVLLAYSPDIEFTFGEIKKLLGPDGRVILPSELDKILKDSHARPEVMRTVEEEKRIRVFGPSLKGKRK